MVRTREAATWSSRALGVASVDLRGYEFGTLNVRHFPMFPGLAPAYAT